MFLNEFPTNRFIRFNGILMSFDKSSKGLLNKSNHIRIVLSPGEWIDQKGNNNCRQYCKPQQNSCYCVSFRIGYFVSLRAVCAVGNVSIAKVGSTRAFDECVIHVNGVTTR